MTTEEFARRVALVLTGAGRFNTEEMNVRGIDVINAIWEVFDAYVDQGWDEPGPHTLELVDEL